MNLQDLTFYASGPLLGCENSLTVVTDTSQVSSQWLLEWLADGDSLFVTLGRDRPRTPADFLDLGEFLGGRPDLAAVEARIAAANKRTVVLQYPTVLLLANLADHAGLLGLIQALLQKSRVIVAVQLSQASIESPLPVSQELTQFTTALLHQASLVLTVRPFATGRADDVTGIFRVSPGPRDLSVKEREYLYTVGKQVTLAPR